MPFCPECKYEYVAGIAKCPDCRVDLVEALPESDGLVDGLPPSVHAELVTVADFRFEVEAQSAKLKLDSYGIKSVLSNEYIAQTDIILAFADGGVHLMVDKDDVQRALEVLASDEEVAVEE